MKRQLLLVLTIFMIVLGNAFTSLSRGVEQCNEVLRLLERSVHSGTKAAFHTFLDSYKGLSKADKDSFLLTCNYDNVFILVDSMQTILLKLKPTAEVLSINSRIMEIVSNCAECNERMDGRFSDYFVRNIKSALIALGNVKSEKLVEDICQRVSFIEGNPTKILEFIRRYKLTARKYYRIFLKYEEVTPSGT